MRWVRCVGGMVGLEGGEEDWAHRQRVGEGKFGVHNKTGEGSFYEGRQQ